MGIGMFDVKSIVNVKNKLPLEGVKTYKSPWISEKEKNFLLNFWSQKCSVFGASFNLSQKSLKID